MFKVQYDWKGRMRIVHTTLGSGEEITGEWFGYTAIAKLVVGDITYIACSDYSGGLLPQVDKVYRLVGEETIDSEQFRPTSE